MGTLDDFIRSQVGPNLTPGEQIVGMGLVVEVTKYRYPLRQDLPDGYEYALAAATNRRLFLMRTSLEMAMSITPRAENRGVQVWHFEEVASVEMRQYTGLVDGVRYFVLNPHPGAGPLGKPVEYGVAPSAQGLDGHAQFASFPGWLQQQVTAGAFPMSPEAKARVEAARAQSSGGAGTLDDFIRSQVEPNLLPGERVTGMGSLVRPIYDSGVLGGRLGADTEHSGFPVGFDNYLAAATDRRLILLRTVADRGQPQPQNRGVVVWDYHALESVALASHHFKMSPQYSYTMQLISLKPHPGLGPLGGEGESYFVDLKTACVALADHERFAASFPAWLQQQVRSGVFPLSPELRAQVEVARARAEAEHARQAAMEAARAAKIRGVLSAWPTIAAVVVLLGSLGLLGYAVDRFSVASRFDQQADEEDAQPATRSGYRPSESTRLFAKSRREEGAQCAVAGVVGLGIAAGLVAWRRRSLRSAPRTS